MFGDIFSAYSHVQHFQLKSTWNQKRNAIMGLKQAVFKLCKKKKFLMNSLIEMTSFFTITV